MRFVQDGNYKRLPFARLLLAATLTISLVRESSACTIFVLTDGRQVLFCNNEDWTNPATRIWFVPAGAGCPGCVYVGYDDGWARGGMNTEGLACDWVGGFKEEWQSDAVTCVRGNPTERLLESCATVEDAIAFFQKHKEPDFSHAKVLVADKNGTSVVIGAHDGNLQIDRSKRSRSFGYCVSNLSRMFHKGLCAHGGQWRLDLARLPAGGQVCHKILQYIRPGVGGHLPLSVPPACGNEADEPCSRACQRGTLF